MSDVNTILVVDDSRVSRMMITAIIKDKQPNWNILEADSADQALELVSGKSIEFFSLDLNMPGRDGLELLSVLKPDYPSARFALLTANIQKSTSQRAQEMGATCINKPITDESISTMLEYFNG